MNKSILFILIVLSTVCVQAQTFSGEIRYQLEYLSVPPQLEGLRDKLPAKERIVIDGNQVRVEGQTAFGASMVKLYNFDTYTGTMMMEHVGNTLAVSRSADDLKDEYSTLPDVGITPTGQSKTIFGYPCSHATLTYPGTSGSYEVFYSEVINFKANRIIKGLGGFPLEFVYNNQGMVIKVTTTSIKSYNPDGTLFRVPADYTYMSASEFMDYLRNLGRDFLSE